MPLSCFATEEQPPASSDVERVLGCTAPLWKQLVTDMEHGDPPVQAVWHHGGKSVGWSLRLKHRERIVLYLTPQRGQFLAGVVLGEKAIEAAKRRGLTSHVQDLLDAAPRYAEGRGIRVTVTGKAELAAVRTLAAAKMGP